MDLDAWRRQSLKHCLWMAAADPGYAQWAAEKAERDSGGLLAGLGDKVRGAILRHPQEQREHADAVA